MKRILFLVLVVGVSVATFAGTKATHFFDLKEIAALSTNGLDEASVKAIVEARTNNGELLCDDDGPCYYYKLEKTADGKYVNRKHIFKVSGKMKYGTFQGGLVIESNIPTITNGTKFAFKMDGGKSVFTDGKGNTFAYYETLMNKGVVTTYLDGTTESLEYTRATFTNDFAWGWKDVAKGVEVTLNATNGTSAYLYAALWNEKTWKAITGEKDTTAYTGVDAACHWATNAVYKEPTAVVNFTEE